MNSNQQMENIEKAFYSDGYKLGMKAASSGRDRILFSSTIQEMYTAIDELIKSLFVFAQQQEQPIDCKKGCEWCCHQPVFAMDYELDFFSQFIRLNFSAEQQNEIKARAKEKNEALSLCSKDDLLNAKRPCPLLQNGVCIAYQARPMACRIYLSSDVNTCLEFYQKPDDPQNFPALLDFPMRAGRMMNEGFKAALKTNGVIAKEFRIEERLKE